MGPRPKAFYTAEDDASGGNDSDAADQATMVTAWEQYGDLIDTIEQELCDLQGLEDPERDKHCGRSGGPNLVWRNVAGRKSSTTGSRTNPVSRAWRRSQVWLSRIVASGDSKEGRLCSKHLRHYNHPQSR